MNYVGFQKPLDLTDIGFFLRTESLFYAVYCEPPIALAV